MNWIVLEDYNKLITLHLSLTPKSNLDNKKEKADEGRRSN
jgi:hypothetical protein